MSRLVLIESDWNLKNDRVVGMQTWGTSINRIRLEFKGQYRAKGKYPEAVLIESDWNLKSLYRRISSGMAIRINRIRLEFKASTVLEQPDPESAY